jgi:hypothetical protein
MKISEQFKVPPQADKVTLPRTPAGNITAKEKLSLSQTMTGTFAKFEIALRARLLGRLLGSVGPLALKVVGGGVFAKYVQHARRPEIAVSFEDAARATSGQVCDVVRYVEQSNPKLIDKLLTALARIIKRRQRC